MLFLGATVVSASFHLRRSAERRLRAEVRTASEAARSAFTDQKVTSELVIKAGTNFSDLLQAMDISPDITLAATQAARPVFNFRHLQQGNRISVTRSARGELEWVCYQIDPDRELWITRNGSNFTAHVQPIPSTIRRASIAGVVDGSLFESVMAAGERPELALRLAEIFAWDVDFYTDPRPGDTFRLLLEKKDYANGQPAAYGRILVAEYNNAGHLYQAVLFQDRRGRPAYYSADGQSLQKAFLRSPLKFAARISSHFSRRRFHPILKTYRPHLGTDYAAPAGMPVQAIAAGRVVFSGRKGGGGNIVQIQHSRGYASYYMHLSRRFVRRGQQVQQGQRIGLVGASGLATGPHLDFRLRHHGAFVNFERMNLPPAQPVPRRQWAAFVAQRDQWMAWLPPLTPTGDHTFTARSQSPDQAQNGGD
jgi:murein DD-endopeptidase MepM/ murein hydrolase activator NlpD